MIKDLWLYEKMDDGAVRARRVYDANEVDKEVQILKDLAQQNEKKLRTHLLTAHQALVDLKATIEAMTDNKNPPGPGGVAPEGE